ncbi:hypothetical protein D3C76_358830 [compost metagenome]
MKKLLSITAAFTLFLSLPSWACDLEEATEKREQLAKQVQKLIALNPEKAKEINDGLRGMKLDFATKDLPVKCLLFDQRLDELKTASHEPQGQASSY